MKFNRIILLSLILCSCDNAVEQSSYYDNYPTSNEEILTLNDARLFNASTISHNSHSNSEEYSSYLNKLENFSCKFISQYSDDENFVVSPISLYFPLAINIATCDTETKNEILTALNMSEKEVIDYSKYLFSNLISASSNHQVKLDNSIWIDRNINVKNKCLENLANNFYTSSFYLNIKNDNANSNKLICEYVKQCTNDLIELNNLFSTETLLAIMNTIYFKDTWSAVKEKISLVAKEKFENVDGSISHSDFLLGEYLKGNIQQMNKYTHFYTQTNNGYKLKFIVPNDDYTIKDINLEEAIKTINNITNYQDDNVTYYTNCYFPKFKTETDANLKEILKDKFSISSLFNGDCDFSPLTDDKVHVETIRQNCVIDVNEYGIEAAAVTIEDIVGESIGEGSVVYQTFSVDKSFAYVLTDPNDIILFSGVIYNL